MTCPALAGGVFPLSGTKSPCDTWPCWPNDPIKKLRSRGKAFRKRNRFETGTKWMARLQARNDGGPGRRRSCEVRPAVPPWLISDGAE
jgi:hypothetical protein